MESRVTRATHAKMDINGREHSSSGAIKTKALRNFGMFVELKWQVKYLWGKDEFKEGEKYEIWNSNDGWRVGDNSAIYNRYVIDNSAREKRSNR